VSTNAPWPMLVYRPNATHTRAPLTGRRYMFGNANKGYDDSGREALDVLSDICGIVLVVKGVFCLLLWLGKYTCCPTCVQVRRSRCCATEQAGRERACRWAGAFSDGCAACGRSRRSPSLARTSSPGPESVEVGVEGL
jgi:hypothetical protein